MALAELNGANFLVLHVLGLMTIVSRILHAWGFQKSGGKHHTGRFWGTALTWLSVVIGCVINLMLIWPYILRP